MGIERVKKIPMKSRFRAGGELCFDFRIWVADFGFEVF
ncbi:hypothetical protein D1AOALGA4SA_10682 [Olavius algarvensis Delta 1 endosymbiont]|nr:hypothetical protein D1AOALGA4SA_10682 [Olavius algarvensis Delta 1 endosymbiont]